MQIVTQSYVNNIKVGWLLKNPQKLDIIAGEQWMIATYFKYDGKTATRLGNFRYAKDDVETAEHPEPKYKNYP